MCFEAELIFDGKGSVLRQGRLYLSEDGTVIALTNTDQPLPDVEVIENRKFRGMLCPGFINSHCHLELSHLKNKIPCQTGLPGFISEVRNIRKAPEELVLRGIADGIASSESNGSIAIGDICNTDASINSKKNSSLRFYNFIETFGTNADIAEERYVEAQELFNKYHAVFPGNCSMVPHAPYSLSAKLFNMLCNFQKSNGGIISMHNQESASENEMFLKGSGELIDTLKLMGVVKSEFKSTGKTSLSSVLEMLPQDAKLMLVHNTYSSIDDINMAQNWHADVAWCFCPNANMYIENRLPDFDMFSKNAGRILLGTDSLASNSSLSMLEEIKTVADSSDIDLAELISWACMNAADFFNWEDLGSFEKGKKPGVNWVEELDVSKMKLLPNSSVQRLL